MDPSDPSGVRRPPAPREIRGPGGALPVRETDGAVLDLLMLVEGETSGAPLAEVLARFSRSRSAYYGKLRRYLDGGLEALLSRPPGPRRSWRRPLEVVRFIVTARLRDPARPAAAIAADLTRLGHVISTRSVERTLHEFGLTDAASPARVRGGGVAR